MSQLKQECDISKLIVHESKNEKKSRCCIYFKIMQATLMEIFEQGNRRFRIYTNKSGNGASQEYDSKHAGFFLLIEK